MTYAAPIVFKVDDDISVRESLELLIRKAGWQSETFETHRNSFLARIFLFRAVWLLTLTSLCRGLHGLELQKRFATDRLHIPIIFITGHGHVPVMVQAMKAGAVEFLTKPFSDTALLSAIQLALESEPALRLQTDMQALQDRSRSSVAGNGRLWPWSSGAS